MNFLTLASGEKPPAESFRRAEIALFSDGKKYYVSRTDQPGKGNRLEGVV